MPCAMRLKISYKYKLGKKW